MKKILVILSILGFLVGSNLVLANATQAHGEEENENRGQRENEPRHREDEARHRMESELKNHAVLKGTVKSKTTNSIVVTSKALAKLDDSGNDKNDDKLGRLKADLKDLVLTGDVTVNVTSETKFRKNDLQIGLNDVAVGNSVMVFGNVASNVVTATQITVTMPKQKLFGEVTAKTDTSVTLKNNVTGETKTVALDEDTKVRINGETKTVADIQVGDKGIVKLKLMINTWTAKFLNLFR